MTQYNVGDKVKIVSYLGRKSGHPVGKTGKIVEVQTGCRLWVSVDGNSYSRWPLDPTEVEKVNTFKVGDRVGFKWNNHWDDGEAEVVEVLEGNSYPYKVKITKQPKLNDQQWVGRTSYWSDKYLTLLPPVPDTKLKFKEGDRVRIKDSSEGLSYKGKTGEVKSLYANNWGGNKVIFSVLLDGDTRNTLLDQNSLEASGPKLKFKVGDRITFNYNEYWNDAIGVIREIRDGSRYPYRIELTKSPSKNSYHHDGDFVNWDDEDIELYTEPLPKDLSVRDLKNLDLGDVVVDTDTDKWVHIGFGQYVFKSTEDELEIASASKLVEQYSPITESVK